MAVVNTGRGAWVTGYNTTINPAIPAGASVGNWLILHCFSVVAGQGAPTVTGGWTQISPGTLSIYAACYAKIATGTDTCGVNFGNQWAAAVIDSYSGLPATITGVTTSDHYGTNISSLAFEALTVTTPGSLLLMGGQRNKTATTNSSNYGPGGSFTLQHSINIAGATFGAVVNDWIQTTATNVVAGGQYFFPIEASALVNETYTIAIAPLSTGIFSLSVANSTLALAGQSATMTVGNAPFLMNAGTGVLNLAGASSTSDFGLDGDFGTVALAGQAENLNKFSTGAFGFTAQGGVLALTGVAATIGQSLWDWSSTAMTFDNANYLLDGEILGLQQYSLSVAGATLTLTGGSSTLTAYQDNFPSTGGFRVRCVSTGVYNGLFYVPGDVFDIVQGADFSDSSVNYEIGGNEYAAGWMAKVPDNTPLFQADASAAFPVFPHVDPLRRFVL